VLRRRFLQTTVFPNTPKYGRAQTVSAASNANRRAKNHAGPAKGVVNPSQPAKSTVISRGSLSLMLCLRLAADFVEMRSAQQ
jgi:hypothetical protein